MSNKGKDKHGRKSADGERRAGLAPGMAIKLPARSPDAVTASGRPRPDKG